MAIPRKKFPTNFLLIQLYIVLTFFFLHHLASTGIFVKLVDIMLAVAVVSATKDF